jgi:hypothetical protein
MDPAAIAGLCAILARGGTADRLPPGVICPPAAVVAAPADPTPTAACAPSSPVAGPPTGSRPA